MAGVESELLQQLSENIERIRQLGLSKGFKDNEIDYCIEQIASGPNKPRRSRKVSKLRRFVRVCCGVGLLLFVLGVVLLLVSTVHPATDRVISQILAPLSYPFFRFLRLGSLPISRRYDLTSEFNRPIL